MLTGSDKCVCPLQGKGPEFPRLGLGTREDEEMLLHDDAGEARVIGSVGVIQDGSVVRLRSIPVLREDGAFPLSRWAPGRPCLEARAARHNALGGDALGFAADPVALGNCKQAKFDGDGELVFVLKLP